MSNLSNNMVARNLYKDFTVGMDIEFFVADGYKLVDPKNHQFKCDYGNMGWDGGGMNRIFELRPNASLNPLTMTENLGKILKEKVRKYPEFLQYNFHAGAFFQDKAIGAHLHYGLSPEDKKILDYNYLTLILDNYVGICSVLLEDREQGLKRRKAGYGIPSKEGYRIQPHGAEYRVCSSFMVSPHITNAFTCLFKVVVFEFLNNKNFPFRHYNFDGEFTKMNVSKLRSLFPDIWTDIQKMFLYPKYRIYIDLIYSLVAKNLGWCPRRHDIKQAWALIKLINNVTPSGNKYNSVSLDAIWKGVDIAKIFNNKKSKITQYNNVKPSSNPFEFKWSDGFIDQEEIIN